MHCRTIMVDGKAVIVCGGKQPPRARCVCCGDYASRQCDYKLGWHRNRRRRVCNAHLCLKCAVPVGDNLDYCPTHPARVVQLPLEPRP